MSCIEGKRNFCIEFYVALGGEGGGEGFRRRYKCYLNFCSKYLAWKKECFKKFREKVSNLGIKIFAFYLSTRKNKNKKYHHKFTRKPFFINMQSSFWQISLVASSKGLGYVSFLKLLRYSTV